MAKKSTAAASKTTAAKKTKEVKTPVESKKETPVATKEVKEVPVKKEVPFEKEISKFRELLKALKLSEFRTEASRLTDIKFDFVVNTRDGDFLKYSYKDASGKEISLSEKVKK